MCARIGIIPPDTGNTGITNATGSNIIAAGSASTGGTQQLTTL